MLKKAKISPIFKTGECTYIRQKLKLKIKIKNNTFQFSNLLTSSKIHLIAKENFNQKFFQAHGFVLEGSDHFENPKIS